MSKKGENIYKRKDGRWEGRYIKFYDENGKAKYGYVYSKSYKETKNKLLEVKVDIYGKKNIGNAKIVYYGKILEEWLELTKINVKESTYTRYKHIVYKHICPDLGKYQLNKISTQLVERFIENKLKFGRLDNKGGLSIKTTNDILMVVKSSIEYAKYHDYSVNCNLDRITIKKKNKEMRVLNLKEQTLLTNYLLQETDLCKFGVMLSLYTGIRVGELCALKWKNFCFESKKLIIQETMIRIQNNSNVVEAKTKVIITEPKSKCSIREIPLPDFLLDITKRFRGQDETFILTGKINKYIEPRTMQYKFQNYLKENGIEKANYHALRHTFATRCVELGFEIKSLSEILGHANVNITLNRYVHSSFELKSSNMNKLTILT